MRNTCKFALQLILVAWLVISASTTVFAAAPSGTLHLTTRAEQSGNPVFGVYFGIYRAFDSARITSLITNVDGTASLPLTAGSYYLRNYGVPFGFLPETARIFFAVTNSDMVMVEITTQRDLNIQYMNCGPIMLPQTGEIFPRSNYLIGMALMGLSVLVFIGLLRIFTRKSNTTLKGRKRRV